jgi:phage-related protein
MRGPMQVVAAVVEGAFNQVRTIIETVLGVIRGVIQTVTSLIKGDWQGAWDGIKQIGESIWDGIKGLVQNGIDTIKGIFDGIVTFFGEIGPRIWNAAKSIWETVKTDGLSLMQEMGQKVIDVFTGLPDKLLGVVPALLDAGKALMGAIFDGLKSAASAVGGFATDIAEAVGGAIRSFVNEQVIDRINRALEFTIPNPLGPDIHINPPDIPHLASGGIITRAGLALVGERGPELVVLPAGAGVFPPERVTVAPTMPPPARPPVPVVVSIELDGRQIARAILPDLRAEADRQGVSL